MAKSIIQLGKSVMVFHLIIFLVSLMIAFSPETVISSDANFSGYKFNFTAVIATIVISVTVVLIALALVGIQGLASGLNDTSTSQIISIVTLAAFWAIMSSVSYQLLYQLTILGNLLYAVLTIVFSMYLIVSSKGEVE